jgi:hypothetical protein
MDYLGALTKKVASTDTTLYKHLESIVLSPEKAEQAPELVDLLVKLNGYQ